MGTTTAGGLPIPTGTDLVRDGDNAIASLGQAIDRRGGGWRTEARTVTVTPNAAGGWSLSFARPFASGQVIATASCFNAAAGTVPVVAFNAVDLSGMSGVAANAMGAAAITTPFNIFYIATGADPNV